MRRRDDICDRHIVERQKAVSYLRTKLTPGRLNKERSSVGFDLHATFSGHNLAAVFILACSDLYPIPEVKTALTAVGCGRKQGRNWWNILDCRSEPVPW
jgi:hypothetical protein